MSNESEESPIASDAIGGDADSEEFGSRVLENAFNLWINPELARRRALGELPEHFTLIAAQRIQRPDGTIIVRINDEVRGMASVRLSRSVQKGEAVMLSDLDGLEGFDILEEELDSGHWTVLWSGTRWFMSFNFLSNRGRCIDLLTKASQFRRTAADATERGHAAVAVDNLFSACELASKALLVASHVVELDAKTHGTVASRINSWRKLGNVEGAFVDLFNRLRELRPLYRYDASQSERMPITDDDLELVAQIIGDAVSRLGPKVGNEPAEKEP